MPPSKPSYGRKRATPDAIAQDHRQNRGAPQSGDPPLNDLAFHSKSLGREARYRIVFPPAYADSSERFPVLYLLHGMYGDRTNWFELAHLPDHARSHKMLVVMPDAANSWYVNSHAHPQDRYEDFIYQDLIAEVDARYRTIPKPAARAIAGLSMGGYAALKFALKFPELFCVAASMTGALSGPLNLGEEVAEFREVLLQAFGPPGDPRRPQNDVFALATTAGPAKLPYLYLDCGAQDSFLPINRDFAALLQKKHIPYEYHELPGGHDWAYWDQRLPQVLKLINQYFPTPARQ